MRTKTRRMLVRHAITAILAAVLFGVFWLSRPQWTAEMRLWKSFGDASLILLVVTLAIGPLVKLSRPRARTLPWRRETGIWFGLLAIVHTVLILNGWARWSVARFFGYEFVEQLGRTARIEPGFGLANLMGLVAIFWTLILIATSSDRALRALGTPAWRWLHASTYVVFYLTLLHAAYFLFIHFTQSFHKRPVDADWFRFPFVAISAGVIALQIASFVKVTKNDRKRGPDRPTAAKNRPRRTDARAA